MKNSRGVRAREKTTKNSRGVRAREENTENSRGARACEKRGENLLTSGGGRGAVGGHCWGSVLASTSSSVIFIVTLSIFAFCFSVDWKAQTGEELATHTTQWGGVVSVVGERVGCGKAYLVWLFGLLGCRSWFACLLVCGL